MLDERRREAQMNMATAHVTEAHIVQGTAAITSDSASQTEEDKDFPPHYIVATGVSDLEALRV